MPKRKKLSKSIILARSKHASKRRREMITQLVDKHKGLTRKEAARGLTLTDKAFAEIERLFKKDKITANKRMNLKIELMDKLTKALT